MPSRSTRSFRSRWTTLCSIAGSASSTARSCLMAKTQQRAAPILLGLSARGRQQVSGWPGEGGVGGTEVSIVDSHIGQLALGDNNNMSIVNLFEVWERQVEQLGPEEEKERARGALRAARDVLTNTAGGAGGRLITDAAPGDLRRRVGPDLDHYGPPEVARSRRAILRRCPRRVRSPLSGPGERSSPQRPVVNSKSARHGTALSSTKPAATSRSWSRRER